MPSSRGQDNGPSEVRTWAAKAASRRDRPPFTLLETTPCLFPRPSQTIPPSGTAEAWLQLQVKPLVCVRPAGQQANPTVKEAEEEEEACHWGSREEENE